jgi:hypothetical protein
MIKRIPNTSKMRQALKSEDKHVLPFIEKYKNKITRISKEGPLKLNIPEFPSLNQSKVISR